MNNRWCSLFAVDFYTGRQLGQLFIRYSRTNSYTICFRNMMAWMHDEICKITIVCHQKKTFAVFIQTTDWINTLRSVLHQFFYTATAKFIAHSSNIAAWFVQHDINFVGFVVEVNTLVVHSNHVAIWIDFLTQYSWMSIDLDFTLLDESVHTLAAAAVVRAFYGKGFFSHPNSQGHQQIANDLLACAKGEGVKAAQLILLENGLKQILAAIDCTKIGHISDVAWFWTGDYSAAQVKQICLRCDAAEPADAVVTKEIIPSTCAEAGKTVYTAKATLAGKELTDVREAPLPLLPHEVEAVDEVEATCDKPGNKAHFACKVCGNLFADADGKTQVKAEDVVVTLPHDLEAVAAVEATCGKPGNKAHYLCKVCGGLFADEAGKTALKAEDVILTKSHTLQEAAAVEPDCTTTGLKAHYKCSFCGKYFADAEAKQELKPEELVLPALGHQYGAPVWTWADDYSKATAETKCVCGLAESAEAEITIKTVDYTCTENGSITYTAAAKLRDQDVTDSKVITLDAAHHYTDGICTVCGDDINEYRAFRVFGSNRYKTAFKVANEMKEVLGIEKFESVVVASGTEFADALAGSYLAIRKNAPILLVRREYIPNVKDYIRQNVKTGGNVYILGGENAISMSMDLGLEGYQVKRLQGSNRYMTNLEILKEAKISEDEKEILVCTGKNFADSLSASALGKPILLVRDTLYEAQKEYLKSLGEGYRLVIIGGEKAVSASLEKELSAYGEIERLDGANRYETSMLLATRFLRDAEPEAAVLAYALNFPDGLCGGPLANALGGPLLLTHDVRSQDAIEYAREAEINYGYVLGGNGLVGDVATMDIFATDKIKVKN